MVAVGCYGHVKAVDSEHSCILLMAMWMHRCRDETLKPTDHHLVLQHGNAQPHVAQICTHFLEVGNTSIPAWPSYSPDMSPTVWDALDGCI